MQKKILSALVWLCLLLTMLPLTVCAAEFCGVRVGDIEITSDNAADVLGDATVVYTPSAGAPGSADYRPATLQLTGAVITADTHGSDGNITGIFSDEDLHLLLVGENTVTAGASGEGNSTGIRVNGTLTVSEAASDTGSLTVTTGTCTYTDCRYIYKF